MKLSNILLASILTSSISACGQITPKKKDSLPKEATKTEQPKRSYQDSVKPLNADTVVDSIPSETRASSHGYCPPCGMG